MMTYGNLEINEANAYDEHYLVVRPNEFFAITLNEDIDICSVFCEDVNIAREGLVQYPQTNDNTIFRASFKRNVFHAQNFADKECLRLLVLFYRNFNKQTGKYPEPILVVVECCKDLQKVDYDF